MTPADTASRALRLRRVLALGPAAALAVGAVLAACGADPNDGAAPGRSLANDYGCLACHSTNGAAGVGPTWKGLFGSQQQLEDGTTVTVDREYLIRSISDPAADVPLGTKVPMPVNKVPAADVQQIVDYIVGLR